MATLPVKQRCELTDRQRAVVKAIVARHVETGQPVSSKSLCQAHGFPYSPATIRNEMVELTRKGYLAQPHTSAGRVPLPPAYRLYVDELDTHRNRLNREMAWVQGELRRSGYRFDAALRLTSAMLAQITRCTAIVTGPRPEAPALIDLSLSPVSARNVLVSFLDEEGNTEQTLIETNEPVSAAQLEELEADLRERLLSGPHGAELNLDDLPPGDAGLLAGIRNALADKASGQVYVEGTTYVLDQPEFETIDALRRVMNTLNRSPVVRRMLYATAPPRSVAVNIGAEHGIEPLLDCSMVAASYHVRGQAAGALGVVGPIRMDYRLAMETVEGMAGELSYIFSRAPQNGR